MKLNSNKIDDINILEKAKLNKLEILDLAFIKIRDINMFSKVNFTYLELDLENNDIIDISIFENIDIKKLKTFRIAKNIIDYRKYSSILMKLSSIKEFF